MNYQTDYPTLSNGSYLGEDIMALGSGLVSGWKSVGGCKMQKGLNETMVPRLPD